MGLATICIIAVIFVAVIILKNKEFFKKILGFIVLLNIIVGCVAVIAWAIIEMQQGNILPITLCGGVLCFVVGKVLLD